jgi:hypothetical protein
MNVSCSMQHTGTAHRTRSRPEGRLPYNTCSPGSTIHNTYLLICMCWALIAEDPHRPTILSPLKANVSRLISYSIFIFPLHQSPRKDEQRKAPEWPRLPLTRESRATNENEILLGSYRNSPSLSPFTTGKATRAHPAFRLGHL